MSGANITAGTVQRIPSTTDTEYEDASREALTRWPGERGASALLAAFTVAADLSRGLMWGPIAEYDRAIMERRAHYRHIGNLPAEELLRHWVGYHDRHRAPEPPATPRLPPNTRIVAYPKPAWLKKVEAEGNPAAVLHGSGALDELDTLSPDEPIPFAVVELTPSERTAEMPGAVPVERRGYVVPTPAEFWGNTARWMLESGECELTQEGVVEALRGLRHFCASRGFDFDDALRVSDAQYREDIR